MTLVDVLVVAVCGEKSAEIAFGNSNNTSDPMRDQKFLIDPTTDGSRRHFQHFGHRTDREIHELIAVVPATVATS